MPYPIVRLKPGKDVPIKAGHPWIFWDALSEDTKGERGMIVEVLNREGASIGLGTWNGNTSIRVRMLTRNAQESIDAEFFAKRFRELMTWKESRLPAETNGYRLVHAEADGMPGLIVDRFDTVFVFQLHTAGMERLRDEIVSALMTLKPMAIVERSDVDVRRREGLTDQPIKTHFGEVTAPVKFKEAGLTFFADVLHGQKTGFFLDQRDARLAVGQLAKDKRVLNLFGYTGAFSVHAAMNDAKFVATVDVSHHALEQAQENFKANGLDPEDESRFLFLEADVLALMQDKEIPGAPYDVIVCDPPAFAKSEQHLPQATKAYIDINAACLRHLEPGGILVTSSCSGRLGPEEFRSLLRIAAGRAGRDVRLVDWIGHPIDHAERLAFPEGRYLKTAVLEVTGLLNK